MDSSKTILWKMICLFLMALFFFSTNAFSARNDVVRIGLNYDISTVNMLEAKLGVDLPVLLAIHEPLMGADPQTGVKIPILAEFFQVMEKRPDLCPHFNTAIRQWIRVIM